MDFQRAGLFDPGAMRVLPPEGPGHDGLVQRLTGLLQLAKDQDCDVFFYGNAFAKDNPHQTDAAFGYTPPTPFGLDNVHMAQGDPQAINIRLHENGVWHDGACFVWDGRARRMTAIFLSFQSQGWHTNDNGDLIYGATGAEAPAYDFSKGEGALIMPPPRPARLTTAHRGPDGACSVVLTNMSPAPLDLTGWTLLVDARQSTALPASTPRSGPADEPRLAGGRSRRLGRRPHARQPGRPQRPLRRLSRRRPGGRLECEPRLNLPRPGLSPLVEAPRIPGVPRVAPRKVLC